MNLQREKYPDQKQAQFPVPQEIFVCFCRKQYKSFPALYLHNKTKHDVTIHIKEKDKMKKKIVWSGNKKKIIYQFSSEDQQSESSKQINERKQAFKMFQNHQERKNRENGYQNQLKLLKEIINKFMLSYIRSINNLKFGQGINQLFEEFINYVNETKLQLNHQLKEKKKIEILPYYFNSFVIQYLPKLKFLGIPYNFFHVDVRKQIFLIFSSFQLKSRQKDLNKKKKKIDEKKENDIINMLNFKEFLMFFRWILIKISNENLQEYFAHKHGNQKGKEIIILNSYLFQVLIYFMSFYCNAKLFIIVRFYFLI